MKTFCNKRLTAGQLLFGFFGSAARYNITIKLKIYVSLNRLDCVRYVILTVVAKVGNHDPDSCNDCGESEHETDENPNASASGFHATAAHCGIAIYLPPQK